MMNDERGCSTCPKGQEKFEEYFSTIAGKNMVRYDFRTEDGILFTTVRSTVEKCREERDLWFETITKMKKER